MESSICLSPKFVPLTDFFESHPICNEFNSIQFNSIQFNSIQLNEKKDEK